MSGGLLAQHGSQLGVAAAIAAASLLISAAAGAAVAVHLPADYFLHERRPLPFAGRPLALRVSVAVLKNLLGVALIAAGVVMSLPGVPGQGLLTILLGLMLVDVPGKHRLERSIVRRRLVYGALNAVRARFGRPPIELPEH